jgi:hypothetical protein
MKKHEAQPVALTPRWTPLQYIPEQAELWNSTARFRVVPAGRRSGKTELAKRFLIIQAINHHKSHQPSQDRQDVRRLVRIRRAYARSGEADLLGRSKEHDPAQHDDVQAARE